MERPRPVEGPWEMIVTSPGACAGPGDLAGLTGWLPAPVPGTAAGALRASGRWSEAAPTPLHGSDVWYRTHLSGEGREVLAFEGLATLCEVWLDGVPVARHRSMFAPLAVEVALTERSELVLAFRSLAAELARPHKRGRWRPRLATPGSLRGVRTSLLGFMPGWCPPVDAVGPYRPVTRRPAAAPRLGRVDLVATLEGTLGRLCARIAIADAPEGPLRLACDGHETWLDPVAPGVFAGELLLPGIAPWWPHTHGTPHLHAVRAEIGGLPIDLGRVGFRTITLTRPFAEGLALAVNGVPVFCRGAVWMPPDLAGLSGEAEGYRPALALVREAGMNMLRVSGIATYEAAAFHALCDEAGILVFQDLMLANFDYPHDEPGFRALLEAEIDALLDRCAASPSLCVVGGGSEVFQQAAMLGYPDSAWAGGFAEAELPGLVARRRPDVVVVPNSPAGGDLPFSTDAGVTHYYGVGAYCRPFEDARRAEVRFATECLAFANVPEPESLAEAGLTDPTAPAWAAGVPRDRGADWDFETVRDHYVAALYGAEPERLRREAPERYLELGRAAVAETMEATFAEWRRARSPTAGGLVFTLRDLSAGASWGVIDVSGRPKSAWYALRRAFRPVQLTLSDEGLNGLHAHLHNETAEARDLTLRLAFHSAEGRAVAKAERALTLPSRSTKSLSSAALLGRFFDATDAYRFGAPAHVLGHASLTDPATGAVIAEAFHFPQARDPSPRPLGLTAALVAAPDGPRLRIATERFALGVQIALEGGRAEDAWFHMAPGGSRDLALLGGAGRLRGTVRAVNGSETVAFVG